MNEMAERVARALWLTCARRELGEPIHPHSFDNAPAHIIAEFRDDARVAIEAMREPTRAMVMAVYDPTEDTIGRIERTWSDMVDAALAPLSKQKD